MELLRIILLVLVGFVASGETFHNFTGGTMSCRYLKKTGNKWTVQVDLVTSWQLGDGPCGVNCSHWHIGHSTKSSRMALMKTEGYNTFGVLTLEKVNYTLTNADRFLDVTRNTFLSMNERIIDINTHLQFEQERALFTVEFESWRDYVDIQIDGKGWKSLTYQDAQKYHVQASLVPKSRNDTGRPNANPVVMAKPIYRIPLDKVSEIVLTPMDPDDDMIRCKKSRFIEAGDISTAPMPNYEVLKNCTIRVSPFIKDNFVDGGLGAIAVSVLDYNKHPVALENLRIKPVGSLPLSKISVQFLVKTEAVFDAPSFVSPTPETARIFEVYVGSTLEIPLYAEAYDDTKTNLTREIVRYHVVSRSSDTFSVTPPIRDDHGRSFVRRSVLSWDPAAEDVGRHVISVNAIDNMGVQSTFEKHYIIVVNDKRFHVDNVHQAFPMFTTFPDDSTACKIGVTCVYPIVATSGLQRTVVSLTESTKSTVLKDFRVSDNRPFLDFVPVELRAEVYFTPVSAGTAKICVLAKDSHSIEAERCFSVAVLRVDLCENLPCENAATCVMNGSDYHCQCQSHYTGKNCETLLHTDPCVFHPCQHGGICIFSPVFPTQYGCRCHGPWKGYNCERGPHQGSSVTTAETTNGKTTETSTKKSTTPKTTSATSTSTATTKSSTTTAGQLSTKSKSSTTTAGLLSTKSSTTTAGLLSTKSPTTTAGQLSTKSSTATAGLLSTKPVKVCEDKHGVNCVLFSTTLHICSNPATAANYCPRFCGLCHP